MNMTAFNRTTGAVTPTTMDLAVVTRGANWWQRDGDRRIGIQTQVVPLPLVAEIKCFDRHTDQGAYAEAIESNYLIY